MFTKYYLKPVSLAELASSGDSFLLYYLNFPTLEDFFIWCDEHHLTSSEYPYVEVDPEHGGYSTSTQTSTSECSWIMSPEWEALHSSMVVIEYDDTLPVKQAMRPRIKYGVGLCAGEGADNWDGGRYQRYWTKNGCKMRKENKDAIRSYAKKRRLY